MIRKLIALVGMAVVLVGCGGGGVGSSLGRVATFFTDSMDGKDHVWVTVYKVELVKSSGPVQVFGSEA
jgi:ABC-type glycerol-3-phosphate transport system substrate-binding protein